LGSSRKSDNVGIINENDLSKEMVLTMIMLFGGTPIILYGEEIGLDQVI
jgi:glycosidase